MTALDYAVRLSLYDEIGPRYHLVDFIRSLYQMLGRVVDGDTLMIRIMSISILPQRHLSV